MLMGTDINNFLNYLQSNAFDISSASGNNFKSLITSMFPIVFSSGLSCLKDQEFAFDVDDAVASIGLITRPNKVA